MKTTQIKEGKTSKTRAIDKNTVIHGHLTDPQGFMAGGLHCGLRRKKLDLGWIYSEVPAQTAGVYTTNVFQAAPLTVTQESIATDGTLQGVIVNSANANSCTGQQGLADAYEMRRLFAAQIGIEEEAAAVVSTGVIGERLNMEKIGKGIENIAIHNKVEHFEQAILTTDQTTKHTSVQMEIDGQAVTIGGAAKGSGMIEPNMATMLGFVTTDAAIEHNVLQRLLQEVTAETFNMITVDGDTSTNDMVLMMANGMAGNILLSPSHPQWSTFKEGLLQVCQSLAKQIASDGEGATKLIEVEVKGTQTDQEARKIAKSIIGSNLVKTAIYGADANWGRIVCAIGYSDVALRPQGLQVYLGDIQVVDQGMPVLFDEEEATTYLQGSEIKIKVILQGGHGCATAWGCDLTYEYVQINAAYRT